MINGYEFRTALVQICPDYDIQALDDGQIVIYTNLVDDGNDNYVRFQYQDQEIDNEYDDPSK